MATDYKNILRGWRSSQSTCLHLSQSDAKLYPEHFLNDAQKKSGKEDICQAQRV